MKLEQEKIFLLKEKTSYYKTLKQITYTDSLNQRKNIAEAQKYLDIAEEIEQILSIAREKAYGKTAQRMEQMLTAFLHDVFPEKIDKESIVFQIETKRQDTALDILIGKKIEEEIYFENIAECKGGSIANIVAAGLRVIALTRSPHLKPFIAFDEPDCWIRPQRVRAFFKILKQAVEALNMQALLISHHDPDLVGLTSLFPTIDAELNNESIELTYLQEQPKWEEEQEGIRSIELENFATWKNNKILFYPGITLLAGDNDIGKSALIVAMRAVLRGESGEYVIRHKEKYAKVKIDLGPDGIVEWIRERKRSRAVWWKLYDKDGNLLHEQNGTALPDWIAELGFEPFRIKQGSRRSEIDAHFTRQKKPAFLLDSSPAERSAILSVGRESFYLNKMFDLHRKNVRKNKRIVKENKEKLDKSIKILKKLESLKSVDNLFSEIEDSFKKYDNLLEKVELGKQILSTLEYSGQVLTAKKLTEQITIPEVEFSIPALKILSFENFLVSSEIMTKLYQEISHLIFLINQNNKQLRILEKITPLNIKIQEGFKLVSTIEVANKISTVINSYKDIKEMLDKLNKIDISIPDTKKIVNEQLLNKMKIAIDFFTDSKKEQEKLIKKSRDINLQVLFLEKKLEKISKELGDMCPFCAQPLPNNFFKKKCSCFNRLSTLGTE